MIKSKKTIYPALVSAPAATCPRIVTNGTHYRIEISQGKFAEIHDSWVGIYTWETRFFWRARRKLRSALKWEQFVQARTPDKWKSVCCSEI